MKKPAPAPLIDTPRFSVHSGLSREDALAYAQQLLHAIEASLDEYCLANASTPGLDLLIGAAHAARRGQVLLVHARERAADSL